MKRLGVVVFLLFAESSALLAQNTHRYLVATRQAARDAIREVIGRDIQARDGLNVRTFTSVDAFAADLTADEVAALQRSSRVRFIEPDVERHALGLATTDAIRNLNGQTQPYGIGLVNAPATWTASRGANINVAILDTGIDYHHPELQGVYAGGFNEVSNTPDPLDDEGHGTHVAGTIAAADNTIGVVGVAPSARVWSLKVLDSSGTGTSGYIIAANDWVLAKKAEIGGDWIISLSLGSCGASLSEASSFRTVLNAGVIVVAAAGNHNPSLPDSCSDASSNSYSVEYPAAYAGVLAVAAVDSSSTVASFSNFGPEVALSGPGVNVLSTLPLGTGSISYLNQGTQTLDAAGVTASPKGSVTSQFVDCGLGKAGDFPASVQGKIALIKRGDIEFSLKARNAKAAGATAVVFYNKDDSTFTGFTLIGTDPTDPQFSFPLCIAISLEDGTALLQNAGSTITAASQPDDYGILSGTSMATPHVAGVAALVWAVAPNATANDVRNALISTAHDIGDVGVDNLTGHGLVDAYAAAKALNPSAFGSPSQPPPPTTPVGRRGLHRGS